MIVRVSAGSRITWTDSAGSHLSHTDVSKRSKRSGTVSAGSENWQTGLYHVKLLQTSLKVWAHSTEGKPHLEIIRKYG